MLCSVPCTIEDIIQNFYLIRLFRITNEFLTLCCIKSHHVTYSQIFIYPTHIGLQIIFWYCAVITICADVLSLRTIYISVFRVSNFAKNKRKKKTFLISISVRDFSHYLLPSFHTDTTRNKLPLSEENHIKWLNSPAWFWLSCRLSYACFKPRKDPQPNGTKNMW